MEIRGSFEDGMPYIPLRVEGKEFNALVDTGYDGFVMLSRTEIVKLGLSKLGKTVYHTADGQFHEGIVYKGKIEWFGIIKYIAIDSTDGEFILVGMKLLYPLRLVMEPSKQFLVVSDKDKKKPPTI